MRKRSSDRCHTKKLKRERFNYDASAFSVSPNDYDRMEQAGLNDGELKNSIRDIYLA